MTGPELLAPAGESRALRAALSAGADAVYFGLERWSARAFAGNFGGEAVPEAVETAHLYEARAYLALNTLLKDDEVEPALAALEAPYRAGLDALIVADLGFAERVRGEYPELPLHASTQLNTHSSAQLAALRQLGFARAILARELGLDEIAALETQGVELEAFVHGALCYGYSGDCLLSSMVGGRSGNRGRCSQSCRLRYTLRRRGSAPLEPSRIMSTSDLSAIGVLPELLGAGVTSFKIEGRMKDAAYVGVTTAVYREALDAAAADPEGYAVRPEWSARLEQSFSRSFTTAHLESRHDEVRSGGRGGHRGVLVGRVSHVDEATGSVEVKLSKPVAEGDVVYLYTPWGQTEPRRLEAGGDASITLRVRERVAVKDRLFRLAAADAGQLARDLVNGRVCLRPIFLTLRLHGREASPAELTVSVSTPDTPAGSSVTVATPEPLAPARTAALTGEKAAQALAALGGTPYRLADFEYDVSDGVFLAVGELKELRRRAVAELGERRLAARRRGIGRLVRRPGSGSGPGPRLAALGATPALISAHDAPPGVVLRLRPAETPLPLPRGGAYCLDVLTGDVPEAIGRALDQLRVHGSPVRVRLPEVLFDADEAWLADLLALRWDAVVTRTPGLLATIDHPYVTEYPLQGLNSLGAVIAADLAGAWPAAVVASPESSLEEVAGLARSLHESSAALPARLAPPAVEILAFGRQQVLHTRDLLGRAEGLYEAPGPGEHLGLLLEDAKGYEFPAEVDAGGTRIFNARVTNLASNLDELREAGVATFIVEQAAMDDAERAAFAAGGLQALAPLASRERSTTGHLFRGVA
ncbi:MAG TPA: U32 family peptidase [Thermoleophilia bacterium]|nr:U32 family peptidase [Thermoleophilia bacterium]